MTKKQGKGGEWTQWIILNIDIRPPKLNKAVEFGKLPNPSMNQPMLKNGK
jgi:hypothetical protein